MKRQLFTISLFLLSISVNSQVNGTTIDSKTKETIPYVNIWVVDENIGSTSDENGQFSLQKIEGKKIIVFSSIGYETKRSHLDSITKRIELNPIVTELPGIVFYSKKETKEKVVRTFEKSKISCFLACGTVPSISASFFSYNEEYIQTPILKTIRFLTKSDEKDSKFNIRLYSVNEKGEPGKYINERNILCTARKGRKMTEIDVSDLDIHFPKNGFYIAVEWLIIEQNKNEYQYIMKDSKKKLTGIRYEPYFGTLAKTETDEYCWVYNEGKWHNILNNPNNQKNDKGNCQSVAIELTLMN